MTTARHYRRDLPRSAAAHPARRPRHLRRSRALVPGAAVVLAAAVAAGAWSAASGSASAVASIAPGHGWIRFGHFAPTTGGVRVRVDDHLLDADATFETVTPYDSVPDGVHTVTVTGTAPGSPTLRATVRVTGSQADTVAALADGAGVELRSFRDDLVAAPAGESRVRVIETAPGVAPVTVRIAADSPATAAAVTPAPAAARGRVLGGVAFGAASSYVDLRAGRYQVVVDSAGHTVVTGRNWPVAAGTVDSIVVVQASTGPTLEILSDAAGASVAPTGGMATGFGGTARRAAGGGAAGWLWGGAGLAVVAALGGVALVRRRRAVGRGGRVPGRRSPATVVLAAGAVLAGLVVGRGVAAARIASPSAVPVARGAAVAPVIGLALPRTTRATPSVSLASLAAAAPVGAPDRLTIPAIGVDSPVIGLGRSADGAAQVPPTTTEVGWYDPGPAPGAVGPAVLLGHVDSYRGPGVFFRLRDLRPGDRIVVTSGRVERTFAVQSVAVYPKAAFPTGAVFGPTPDRALRLVTCGGPFDGASGHYVDNVVVFATETGSEA